MIGLVSRMAGMVLLGLATTTAAMFAVPVVSLFSSFSVAALRAMLSKLVDSDELGQSFKLNEISLNGTKNELWKIVFDHVG